MNTATLNDNIKDFYDRSTDLWLDVWGEHMHHGYYGADGTAKANHQQAQIDLLNQLLSWGEVNKANNILDAGCGVGGSARFLAQKFDANVTGVTLSPIQARRAQRYNEKANLVDSVDVRVQDMMTLRNEAQRFDLVWSLESAEHIPPKRELLQLFYDLLQPDGKLLMVTWCTRAPVEELSASEQQLLKKIERNYHLPPMIPMASYKAMAQEIGYQNVQTDDWTAAVAPFWQAVIRSALSWSSVKGLLKAGLPTLKGAWTMRYMREGYQRGLLKFALLQGDK
ncbi:MAG: class I SAM-dependent methyltransferase [Saprospiraceae bacterium]